MSLSNAVSKYAEFFFPLTQTWVIRGLAAAGNSEISYTILKKKPLILPKLLAFVIDDKMNRWVGSANRDSLKKIKVASMLNNQRSYYSWKLQETMHIS